MAVRNPDWTREELILALDLHLRRWGTVVSKDDPEIIKLSELLNSLPIHSDKPNTVTFRNPNGVFMKLGNFLRLDPNYPGEGLPRGNRLERMSGTTSGMIQPVSRLPSQQSRRWLASQLLQPFLTRRRTRISGQLKADSSSRSTVLVSAVEDWRDGRRKLC
jgi:hypothetical protein